jgi:GNAT superfamily N-acetyltransferase
VAILPTTDDAKRRLDFIDAFGVSPFAFEMGQQQPALVIEHVGLADGRVQEMIHDDDRVITGDDGALVVAELDGNAVACGGYRRVDDATAQIKRMYVAQPARGMKIGAAIVAELEAAATRSGFQRLLLETTATEHYERFGFRRSTGGDASCMEKSLAAEPSRLA